MDLSNLSDAELDALDEEAKKQEEEKNAPPEITPEMQAAEDARNRSLSPAEFARDVGITGVNMAIQHPSIATGLIGAGGGGYAAKHFLVNPVIEALKPAAQAVGQRVNDITDALNRQAAASEAYSKGVAERAAARTAAVATAPVAPTPTTPGIADAAGRPIMPTPTAPEMGGFRPAALPTPTPTQPPTAMNFIERMEQMAKEYAPVAKNIAQGAAQDFGKVLQNPVINNAITNNPLTRFGFRLATNPLVQGMTYSPELNVNEQAELERRRKMKPTIR